MPTRQQVRQLAWFAALGSAGLLIQDKFHGLSLGNWAWVAWIIPSLAVTALFFTEEHLRPHRPTLHYVRSNSSVSISMRAPEKPWRGRRKKEVEIGHRAIEVSQRVLAAVAAANRKMAGHPFDREHWDAYHIAYQQTLHELQAEVGAEWHQVLVDLEGVGTLPDMSRNHYEISINYTGLDTFAIEVEALGRDLLHRHGVDSP